MHEYSINLEGRVKNFNLPKNRPLIPLFEAIVNSLHAIEERKNDDNEFDNGNITIEIVRSEENKFIDDLEFSKIEGFVISDNGIGFNERNMRSFLESDSIYKAEIGGKGVGRFSWLKTFERAHINSIYKEKNENIFLERMFEFSLKNPTCDDCLNECFSANDYSTTIKLESYLAEYGQGVPNKAEMIARFIVQHILIYLLNDNCPNLILKDGEKSINLNEFFKEKYKTEENKTEFKINEIEFTLLNVKIQEKSFGGNRLYLCANNRLVKSKKLEMYIVDLNKQIFDRNGFWYLGVLTSKYFDENVDMNRLSFSIPENGMTLINSVSMEQIINVAKNEIERYLCVYLSQIGEEKQKRIKEYATKVAPQYRHLLKHMPEEIAQIKPDLSDDSLEEALHKIKRIFDKNAKKENEKLLKSFKDDTLTETEYETNVRKQIEKISDANSSALAEYVAHRKVILDLFECGLYKKEDGKFNKELYMHELIYPTRKTSDDLDYENHNLWIIDEKLSYCSYISSDIPFSNDPKKERTDILVLDHPVAISEGKNDGTIFDTIILFELKRPMRNDYSDSENPIIQLYKYLSTIKSGKAEDKNGRKICVNDSTKFYLYAICDKTDTLDTIIEHYGFSQTPDNMGYYAYNSRLNAYIEILSYSKILLDSKKRNRVLFEKLGI